MSSSLLMDLNDTPSRFGGAFVLVYALDLIGGRTLMSSILEIPVEESEPLLRDPAYFDSSTTNPRPTAARRSSVVRIQGATLSGGAAIAKGAVKIKQKSDFFIALSKSGYSSPTLR